MDLYVTATPINSHCARIPGGTEEETKQTDRRHLSANYL